MRRILSFGLLGLSFYYPWLLMVAIPVVAYTLICEYTLWWVRWGRPWKRIYTPVSRAYMRAVGQGMNDKTLDIKSNLPEEGSVATLLLLCRMLTFAYPHMEEEEAIARATKAIDYVSGLKTNPNNQQFVKNLCPEVVKRIDQMSSDLIGQIVIADIVKERFGGEEACIFLRGVLEGRTTMLMSDCRLKSRNN